MLSVGVFFVVVLGYLTEPIVCSQKYDQLVDTAVNSLKLNPIIGLDDLKLSLHLRYWLLFHRDANLTCLWGSVYPLENLTRTGEPTEQNDSSGKIIDINLSSSGLGYRFDSCVLKTTNNRHAEPIWGELHDNMFDFELKLTTTSTSCEGTVTKLGIRKPSITYTPGNQIVKKLGNHASLDDLTEAIASNIQKSVNFELTKHIGQKMVFPLSQCA